MTPLSPPPSPHTCPSQLTYIHHSIRDTTITTTTCLSSLATTHFTHASQTSLLYTPAFIHYTPAFHTFTVHLPSLHYTPPPTCLSHLTTIQLLPASHLDTIHLPLLHYTPVLTCLSPPLFHCNTKQLTALETMHEIFISIHKKEHKHTRDVNTRQKSQNLLGSSLRRVLETFH